MELPEEPRSTPSSAPGGDHTPGTESQRLTRRDWVAAGLDALAAGGARAIGVQALARTLGVTKGSFYWHFRDLAELRGEMAAHWRRVSTVRFIARLEGLGLSPRDTLVAALAGEQRPASDLGPGIRAWALTDAAVAAEVERMGVSRTSYLADLLRRGGLSPRVARERAPFLQAALLGLESGGAPPGGPEGAASVIDALLTPPGDRR